MNKVQKERLIEELAKLRHDQMRSWSSKFFIMMNNFKQEGKTLDDFGNAMMELCSENWKDYDELEDEYKRQSRTFALAVIDIVNKHNGIK